MLLVFFRLCTVTSHPKPGVFAKWEYGQVLRLVPPGV